MQMKKEFVFLIIIMIWGSFHNMVASHDLPALHVEGKWIKNSEGENVTLRGINVIDPIWLRQDMQSMENAINKVAELHAKVVRLPVHPRNWDGDNYYNNFLKPTIDYCREKGLYVIIDWHVIGKWGSEDLANSTHEFWSYIAPRHKDDTHVLFEFMNEPTEPRERNIQTWNAWKEWAQPFVDTIRYYAPDNLILVGSPHWSQLCQFAPESPFEGNNLAYVMHLYPAWHSSNWPTLFGEASKSVPIFISEWGYGTYPGTSGREYHGTTSGFGIPFKNFLEEHPNISWTAWVYHYAWNPWMIDRQYNLLGGNNFMGQFTAEWLYEKKDSNLAYPVVQKTNVWEETDGIIIIEAENNDSDFPTPGGWEKESSAESEGFTGEGYIRFNKPEVDLEPTEINYQEADKNLVLTYWIKINQPGVYVSKIRNLYKGEELPGSVYISADQSIFNKVTSQDTIKWDWNEEDITFEFEGAGIYKLELLGSSYNFLIDRIVLFHNDLSPEESYNSPESEITNGYHLDNVPPTPTENLRVSEISTSTAHVLWDHATDNISVAGYNVYINFRKVNSYLIDEPGFELTQLDDDTEYNVRIEAIDWAGNTSMSPPVTFQTDAISTRVGYVRDNPFTIYPNPGKGVFKINWDNPDTSIQSIRVINMKGQTRETVLAVGQDGVIDISHLTNGVYIFVVSLPNGNEYRQKVHKF